MSQSASQPPTPESVDELAQTALSALDAIADAGAVEEWRVLYLGRRGLLTGLLRGLSGLEPELAPDGGRAG